MQLNLDSDWGVLFVPDSNVHSSKICHRICTQHHNTHANYILIIKHSNKQTERKSPRNHQVLMEQALAWCGWPDSLLLDQSFAGFERGGWGVGGCTETHWCHCLALQSYREKRCCSVAAERASTMAGTNPDWIYWAAFKWRWKNKRGNGKCKL